MSKFALVADQVALADAVAIWQKEKELAIDIECENNQHRYGRHLALLQISTRTDNWIVDPLPIEDLSGIVGILENKDICKVFHDVGFDFRILLEKLDCKPHNVFDTKRAAQLLGRKKIGLGALLEEEFGLEKEKKYQRVDWTKRPLSEGMLSYAVLDSAYLLPLMDKLTEALTEMGRFEWVQQEFYYLTEEVDYTTKAPSHMNVTHAKSLTDRGRAILHKLFDAREALAQEVDRPTYYIFNDKRLIELVKNPPRGLQGWQTLRGVHPAIKRRASLFLNAVEEGKKAELEPWPRSPPRKRFSQEQHAMMDKLLEIREKIGTRLGLEPSQIISKDQITLASHELSLEHVRKWQKELLEKELS